MKLIDQKGKLFGLINIIDLVVLVALIAVLGFAGYKVLGPRLNPGTGVDKSGENEVIFTVRCYEKLKSVPDQLKKGDQLVSITSNAPAYIESVEVFPAEITSTRDDGVMVTTINPTRNDLLITVKARINTGSDLLKLGTQEIAVGKGFYVKTQTAEAYGFVEKIDIR